QATPVQSRPATRYQLVEGKKPVAGSSAAAARSAAAQKVQDSKAAPGRTTSAAAGKIAPVAQPMSQVAQAQKPAKAPEPIKAAEAGTVAYAGSEVKGYGNLVLIRHENGFVSAYAHNGEIEVKRGQKVARGQVVAKSGQTGNVTSPQLHFEIRKGSTPVDPMP